MSMKFHTVIQRDAKTVYDLLTDLRGYQSWLPSSSLYKGVREISESPLRVGTTYKEGTNVVMEGRVVELEPNRVVAFEQRMKRRMLGVDSGLVVRMRYVFEPSGEFGTLVKRDVKVSGQGLVWILLPVLLGSMRKENERIMQRMKLYLEAR